MLRDRLLFLGLAGAFLAAPGHPSGLLPGPPLGSVGLVLALIILIWGLALPGGFPRIRLAVAVVACLLVAKVTLAWLSPPYGLVAEYRMGGPDAPVERSTEWPRLGATRVDRVLRFEGAQFPVHFFNDVQRFNYFTANEPQRDLLPFSVRWRGQFWAGSGGTYRFGLEANGTASLSVVGLSTAGGGPLRIESGNRLQDAAAEATLTPGLHPIEILYSRPHEGMPWLSVTVAEGAADPVALAAPRIVHGSVDPSILERDGLLGASARAVDLAYLALVAIALLTHARSVVRAARLNDRRVLADASPGVTCYERLLLGLFALAALSIELWSHLRLADQTLLLSGGNDWLAYEGFARDVLLNGPLLQEGRELGQGLPFYYQPLYIYWLALVHAVLGEGMFGPLFANAALGVAANVLVYVLARELFGRASAIAALLLFAGYRVTVFAPTAGLLLSENLVVALVPLLLLLLVKAARSGSWRPLIGAGVVLGLAGLTRTTPLAVLPPALLVLALSFRRLRIGRGAGVARLLALIAVCLLTLSPATARNYVVSGKPVLVTSSGGANLWEMHRPSDRVDLSRIDSDLLYERLGLDRRGREVAEYIRQDPSGYVGSLVPMALYAVGLVGAPSGTTDVHTGLLGMSLAYLLVVLCLPSARTLPSWIVHAFVLTHLAQMTVFMSNQYGFRLILPMYVAMAPVVGHGLATVGGVVARLLRRGDHARRSRRVETRTLPLGPRVAGSLLVAAVGSLSLFAGTSSASDSRESFYGLSGDSAIAARQALRPEYLRSADMVYFVGDDSRTDSIAYLRGLAYPAMHWFDGSRGLVLPRRGEQALYVLPDRAAPDLALRCLRDDAMIGREQDWPSASWFDLALAGPLDTECSEPQRALAVPFEDTARITGYDVPGSIEPGKQMEITVRWEPTHRPANRTRPFVRVVDTKGRRWGQAEVTSYPSSAWRPGETALGAATIDLDPTLPPGEYGLEFGFTVGSGMARVAADGPWGVQGQPQARAGLVKLVSRSSPLEPDALPITIAKRESFGDVRLLGAIVDRDAARPGERVRLSLFWQNAAARLLNQEVSVIFRDASGDVLVERRGVPVDGTYSMDAWKLREVVRDTWDLVIPARASSGSLDLAVGVAPPGQPVASYLSVTQVNVQPISRDFEEPNVRARQEAQLGELARLVGFRLRDRRLKPGENLELDLIWQALAETPSSHLISVQLQAADRTVIASQEAEPAGGKRPTMGWLPGEYVEDGHRLRISRDTPPGRYQLTVAVVRSEDGRRLLDPSGADRVILSAEVVVE